MPYFIRNYLVLRRLKYESDLRRRITGGKFTEEYTVEENRAGFNAVGRCGGLQLPEQRCLAAAGRSAERDEFASFDCKADFNQCCLFTVRVCKRQVFDAIDFQSKASFIFTNSGNAPKAK